MMRRLLDLFCCAGGAAAGYAAAGFEVYGVDIDPQPRYPFAFARADALALLRELIDGGRVEWRRPDGSTVELGLADFDAIHASPPCQAYSATRVLHTNEHPELVEPTRELLEASGLPWIMENVAGAPLREYVVLCGSEFGLEAPDVDGVPLKLIRHRLFESNVWLMGAGGCRHNPAILTASIYGAGGGWTPEHRDNPDRRGGYVPATSVCAALLRIDWMSKRELSQVVPPIYAEYLGEQLIAEVAHRAAALV